MISDATRSTTSDAGTMNDASTTPGWGTPVPGGPAGIGAAATVTINVEHHTQSRKGTPDASLHFAPCSY
jgi:hypothetical protein